ncbi:hypothetical protein [Ectopseudomonas composti]|uniref:hypothetical protein n=1 Tax=Ectopseudomonas composti TaxID=658457 RepID=UPI00103AA908|nr:hypothetical protein [Pseudomonas composti]
MKTICAFSSDSRSLYKADIYRALSLPHKSVIHFRYKTKYVSSDLLISPVSLEGKKVAIFFTRTDKTDPSKNKYENISVRWASISSVEMSKNTDVFHVYMKLEDFCNLSISDNTALNQPPEKFLSFLECKIEQGNNNWQSRINALKDYLPPIMYFHVKNIKSHWNTPIKLKTSGNSRSFYYKLTHGEKYTLQLAIANPHSTESKIELSDGTGEVVINCTTPLECSAQFDDIEIPIFVKSLQVSKQASFLKFNPIKDGEELGEYASSIELELKLSTCRSILFGLCSVLVVAAILLASPTPATAKMPAWWMYLLSGIVLWAGSGAMFHWFNKK